VREVRFDVAPYAMFWTLRELASLSIMINNQSCVYRDRVKPQSDVQAITDLLGDSSRFVYDDNKITVVFD
jgi:hypothetical protein